MNLNDIPISKALIKLTSTIKWDVENDFDITTLNWYDDTEKCPSKDEINNIRLQMANEYNAIEYITLRKEGKYETNILDGKIIEQKIIEGYPTLENQLDMLYHDIKNNNIENGLWITSIDKIKEQFPKPSEETK